jgi:hypothetical protein
MDVPDSWEKTPRHRIELETTRRGTHEVAAGCIEMLSGREADPDLILALGGPPARWVVTGEPPGPSYWLRVWGARGLLWAWDDVALDVLLEALDDEAWRVREMALKVVGRHRLGDALARVCELQHDPSPRVRATASRVIIRLGASGK